MMSRFLLSLCSLVCVCTAVPTWTTLRTTWGMKIWNSNVFAKVPLTVSDTSNYGFNEIRGDCTDGKFRGIRYVKEDNPAVVLIYDSKGFVAGIQSGLPKYEVDKVNTTYPFSRLPAFQLDKLNDEDVYFRTAYFYDPSKICQSERTEEEFERNIGTGLWIQNGNDPIKDSFEIPRDQDGMKDTDWVKGGCFPTMGRHYWYKTSKSMNCNDFFPYFVMFNRNTLTGFGFASAGNFLFSNRFEHPPKGAFARFLDPVPDCFANEFDKSGGFTTMHVYFTVKPWNLAC